MRVMLGLTLLPGSFPVGWRHQGKGRGNEVDQGAGHHPDVLSGL